MRMHGGEIHRQSYLLDFSANINPLGMPDSVREAVFHSIEQCGHYPDPQCSVLTKKLSEIESFPASQIVCGNGAADLIYRIVHAIHPKRGLVLAPTFSEYRFAMKEIGCDIKEFILEAASGFQPDESIVSSITDDLDILFLCTPNNPIGKRISPYLLKNISDACIQHNVIFVCDECFLRFTEKAEDYSLRQFMHENCIILNAFTKLYAIPGLRLGYVLCGSERIADQIRNTGQFWSVSVPAQAAGIAALNEPDWISNTVHFVKTERQFLMDSLKKSGFIVFDSDANFILFNAASELAKRLQQRGILIRQCADFHGLTDAYFRIAVRTHNENLALISAIREVSK